MGNDGRTGNQLYALQCNRIYTCTDTQLHLVQVLDIPHKKKSNTWRQVLLFSIAFGMAYGAQFLFLIGLVEGLDCNEYLAQFLGLFIYGSVNFLMNKRVTFR